MKKRRFSSHSSHDELCDVNEQELAKDGECPFDERYKSDTAKQPREAVPDFVIEQDRAVVRSNIEPPVPLSTSQAKTHGEHIKQEEHTEDKAEERSEESSDAAAPPKNEARVLARLYGAVIVLCIIASIVMIFMSASATRAPQSEQSDTSEQTDIDSSPAPQPTPNAPLSDAESVYQRGINGTVTVISQRDGEKQIYTGFAVFEGGYIATLYEAVCGESTRIVTHDGRAYPCEVVGKDASVNLALLRADAALEPLKIQSTPAPSVGEGIFAIANLGSEQYTSSLLAGEVSYVGRQCSLTFPDGVERRANTVQLSSIAPVGVGGCPIFNREGAVIALMLPSPEDTDVTFAYSISDVLSVLDCMRAGSAPTPESVYALAYAPARLGILGEQATEDGLWGVAIRGFSESASDAAAVLRLGDLIYKINDTLITGVDALSSFLDARASGESIEVFVLRGERRMSFLVEIL